MSDHTRCIRAEFTARYIRMFYANGLSFKEERTPMEESLRMREAMQDGAIIVKDADYFVHKRSINIWLPAIGIAVLIASFIMLIWNTDGWR